MHAVQTHVVPIAATDPLADAVEIYIAAKRAEDEAREARICAEDRILELRPPREEGSETFEAAGFKVTTTGKLTYACADIIAMASACEGAGMPASWVPIKTKRELDATGAKWLRENEPELWARVVAPHITIKPAKTAVSVKV